MTIIKITFTDKTIELDNNFILFKTSSFFKNALDCDENEILLPFFESSIIDNFKKYNNFDFLVTLSPDIFITTYDFLNFILCEYNNGSFIIKFIKYIIENKIHLNGTYFMSKEIRDCNNYMNNININKQIQLCSISFYSIYLNNYKEEVIKNNRHDIYNCRMFLKDKTVLFKYVHKYNNNLTEYLKSTQEYITYIDTLGNNIMSYIRNKQYNKIKDDIDNGANIFIGNANILELLIESTCRDSDLILYIIQRYLENNHINTNTLNAAIKKSRLNIIKYLMKHCNPYIDIKNANLFDTIKNDKLNILKYLISQGAPILMVDNTNSTLLMYACKENNIDIIQYIINTIPVELLNNYIYTQDNKGKIAIQYATNYIETFNIFVPYINNNIENGKQILTSSLENMNTEVIYKTLKIYSDNLTLLLDFIEPNIYFIDVLYDSIMRSFQSMESYAVHNALGNINVTSNLIMLIKSNLLVNHFILDKINNILYKSCATRLNYIQSLIAQQGNIPVHIVQQLPLYIDINVVQIDMNLIYQLCNYILEQNITTELINKMFTNIIKYNDINLVSIFLNNSITLEMYHSIFDQIILYRNKIYLCTFLEDFVVKEYLKRYNDIATLVLNDMKINYPHNNFQINDYIDNNNTCIFIYN